MLVNRNNSGISGGFLISLTIRRTELIRGAYGQGIFLLHGNGVLALSSYGGIGRECVVAGREEFAGYSTEAVVSFQRTGQRLYQL